MEFLIFGIILVILILFSTIFYFSSMVVFQIGAILIMFGLLVGVPAGCYYHFLLFTRRKHISSTLTRWWIAPNKYHKYFSGKDRLKLNKWFSIGAFHCNISLVGCVLSFLSIFIKK